MRLSLRLLWRGAVLVGALTLAGTAAAAGGRTAGVEVASSSSDPAGSPADHEPKAKHKKSKTKHKRKKKRKPSGLRLGPIEARAALRAGVVNGRGVRRFSTTVVEADAGAAPSLIGKKWALGMPVQFRHAEPLAVDLRETRGQAGLELKWRPIRQLRPFAEARFLRVWRPGWPDLYQPRADGTLTATSRHGYSRRQAEVGVATIPVRHHHARLKYRYSLTLYEQDPNFDPIEYPTHLVPDDHEAHAVDLSWRYISADWSLALGVEADLRRYFFEFARDAGTGRTHAVAGGLPPNPLFETLGITPDVSLKLELSPTLVLRSSFAVEFLRDMFEGYYSFVEHRPGLELEAEVGAGVFLDWRVEIRLRRYGPGSYAPGTGHPELEYGERRVDRQERAQLGIRVELSRSWSLTFDSRFVVRRTNFPDYAPGVFPRTRAYDIEWDYENWAVLVGAAYR